MADSYLEKQNRHQVYLSRLAGGILKDDVYPSINSAYKQARLVLADFGDINSLQDLNRVNRAVTKAINEALDEGFTAATQSMNAIAVNEAAYQAAALTALSDAVVTAPSESKITRYVRDAIMTLESGRRTSSAIWPDYVKGYAESMSRQYNSIITSAYSESLDTGVMPTLNQISQRFRVLNNELLRRDAEALVRTGVQHYAQQASNLMAQDNADIIDREIPVVTFDSRTSDICISLNDKYPNGWPLGKSPVGYAPYHFNAVVGGEMVKTSNGNKPIEDVAVGDLVVTHKGRLRPVTAVMRKLCDTGLARKITFESGLTITVTDEHPLLVDGIGWVRADEVKVGDNLFKNIKKVSKLLSRLLIVESNPNDYPSMFDGDEVFSEVATFPGAVSSAVDFNADLMIGNGKVHNSILKNELVNKIMAAVRLTAVFNKCKLALDSIPPMPISLPYHKGFVTCSTMKRVFGFHPFGVSLVNIASFLRKSISPVGLALASLSKKACNFTRITLCHRFDTMNPAPSRHSPIGEVELPLNHSKGLFERVVMLGKEFSKKLFISKFNHWDSQVVKSISIVEHNEMVYNLEVEEDHTYLINGIVTHNCRTRILYLLKGQAELDGTKTSKGAEGGKQIEANTPFSKWLRDQPRGFIEETLGKKRADLFLSGRLPLANLTDKYLNPLPISDLKLNN